MFIILIFVSNHNLSYLKLYLDQTGYFSDKIEFNQIDVRVSQNFELVNPTFMLLTLYTEPN